ncbi:MAG: hypothetical protein ACR2NO_02485 [Chloroflexota bacterium]
MSGTSWHSIAGEDTAPITWVEVHLSVTNSSPTPGGLTVLRLEIDGGRTYYPDEPTRAGNVDDRRWIPLAVNLDGWNSASGWIRFGTQGLTVGAARKGARLVAFAAGSGEMAQQVPAQLT